MPSSYLQYILCGAILCVSLKRNLYGCLLFSLLLFFCFEAGCQVAQASLELLLMLPQSPKYWDYKRELLFPAFVRVPLITKS